MNPTLRFVLGVGGLFALIGAAMAFLPEEQRVLIGLVCIDGLSYKEAAEVARVPVGTIMSRLARARIALHQQLAAGAGVGRSATNAAAQ